MAFSGAFSRVFSPPLGGEGEEELPWWNPDGATPGGVGGSCIGAYRAKGAANYAASLVNLPNVGTYDLSEIGGGSVNWDAVNGWTGFSLLGRCLDTGINPTPVDQSWSIIVQYSGATHADNFWMGLFTSVGVNGAIDMRDRAAGAAVHNGDRANLVTNAPAVDAAGNYGLAGVQPYRNGIAEGIALPISTETTGLTIYIGARNQNGAAIGLYEGGIASCAIYNVVLTAPQVLARRNRMAAL